MRDKKHDLRLINFDPFVAGKQSFCEAVIDDCDDG